MIIGVVAVMLLQGLQGLSMIGIEFLEYLFQGQGYDSRLLLQHEVTVMGCAAVAAAHGEGLA